ncbi:MAG: hypothetical protein ABIQ57_05695 [Candidatus Kapaibacterium sp.]
MINLTHPKWSAIRLYDRKSIEYLNEMFKHGWYILPFNRDGVEYLMMDVPAETPKHMSLVNEHQILDVQRKPSYWIVILNKGDQQNRQRAVYTTRDESGYHDMGKRVPSIEVWRPIITKVIEDDGMVTIYEMGLPM